MLITPITPKVMARPIAARSSTEPSDSPYQTFCSASHSASSPSMVETAACAAAPTGPSTVRSGREERKRVPPAAVPDHLDRRDLLLFRQVGVEDRRGARLAHQLGDGRVGLLFERGVDQFDRFRVAAQEDGFRRRPPRRGVRAHQRQPADRGADDAAKLVVDLDLLERARRLLADRFAGERVDQAEIAARLLGDEHHAVGLADVEVTGRERFERRDGGAVAGGGDGVHLLLGLGIVAFAERVDQVAEIVLGEGRHGGGDQKKQTCDGSCGVADQRGPEMAGRTTHPLIPAQAGIQFFPPHRQPFKSWIPACAGMSGWTGCWQIPCAVGS